MNDDLITLLKAPSIPNLRFRHYRGEGDLSKMVQALQARYDTDKVEQVYTLANQHLVIHLGYLPTVMKREIKHS